MKKDDGLSALIYEYYESRILFGHYRYGEQLVSVSQICNAFQVGRNTVLTALGKLEENGYIVTEERKVARIAYQGTKEIFYENIANYFVPRKDGILDFSCAGKLLLLPMWQAGLKNQGLDLQSLTYQDIVRSDTMPAPVKLYSDVLCTFHINIRDEVLAFVESASEKYHLEHVRQIPFQWTICRQRPQVRYTLAARIIREILWEHYPVGGYLPSMPQMAEQYQVSLSTVRRALAVLQPLGVTRTYMGIGTKVCLEPVDFSVLDAPEIQESLRLHGEGLQLLSLTVRGVTLYTLESVSEQKRNALSEEIARLQGKASSILCIDVLLSFISSECPSGIIRECYGKLRELVAWGYILSAVLLETGQLDFHFDDVIIQSEKDLQAENLTAFADRWQSFIENRMNFFYSKFPPQT